MASRVEWTRCYARIAATWPRTDWPAETLEVYYEALGLYDYGDLVAAIRVLSTRQNWAPSLKELVDEAREVRSERLRRNARIGAPPTLGQATVDAMTGALRSAWTERVAGILEEHGDGAVPVIVAARGRFVSMFGERDWYDDVVAEQAGQMKEKS